MSRRWSMQRACHNPAVIPLVLAAAPDVLVSRQLAARAHLNVGDLVTLAADPAGHRSSTFRVAGVYEPTPDPMRFTAQRIEARMHLPDVIALTCDPADPNTTDAVDAINIALTKGVDATRFSSDVAGGLPMIAARPTARAP